MTRDQLEVAKAAVIKLFISLPIVVLAGRIVVIFFSLLLHAESRGIESCLINLSNYSSGFQFDCTCTLRA